MINRQLSLIEVTPNYLLGILPVGISFAFSWIRIFCQSTKWDCSTFNVQCCLLKHWRPRHMAGCRSDDKFLVISQTLIYIIFFTSVYRNCCTTSFITLPHSLQVKEPYKSSGRTSVVLVTVPLMLISRPTLSVRSCLTRAISGTP